jgi:hypothetical protein
MGGSASMYTLWGETYFRGSFRLPTCRLSWHPLHMFDVWWLTCRIKSDPLNTSSSNRKFCNPCSHNSALTYKSRILHVDALPDPSFTEAFTRSKGSANATLLYHVTLSTFSDVTVGCGIGRTCQVTASPMGVWGVRFVLREEYRGHF